MAEYIRRVCAIYHNLAACHEAEVEGRPFMYVVDMDFTHPNPTDWLTS